MTAELIIAFARGFIGLTESPAGSNNVIFNTHYYGKAVSGSAYPWCAAYVWDIFRIAGASALYYGGNKTASCTTLMNWGKAHGLYVSSGYKAGDLIFYNWNGGTTTADHVGICTVDYPGTGKITTVEGNTSVNDASNGGQVIEMARDMKYVIGGYRPLYSTENNDTTDNNMTQEQFETLFDERFNAKFGTAFNSSFTAAFNSAYASAVSISKTGDNPSGWAKEAVTFVKDNGIFSGDGEGNYGWQKPLTREQAATLIKNSVDKFSR